MGKFKKINKRHHHNSVNSGNGKMQLNHDKNNESQLRENKFKRNNGPAGAGGIKKPTGTVRISNNNKLLFSKQTNNYNKKQQTKKDKQKSKRSGLIQKINLIKKEKLEEIQRIKREKTLITGDLKPLKDALPSLDELFQLKPNEIKTGIEEIDKKNVAGVNKLPPRNKNEKSKLKKQEYMKRYNCFTNLLKDKDYQRNPRETIAYHIEVTTNQQNM